jgi:hypothetical protein
MYPQVEENLKLCVHTGNEYDHWNWSFSLFTNFQTLACNHLPDARLRSATQSLTQPVEAFMEPTPLRSSSVREIVH